MVYGGYVLGALMLVGACLAWRRRRWGMLLGLVAAVVNRLLTVPGIAFALAIGWQIASAVGVLLATLLVVVLPAPASRRADA
ncbi:MAG TPA: hypothetical protein VFN57_09790 [Thermomicrobiaceae bacterium]|nr:hypothetical protein [Thermomicrobiaceae bacterium]